MAEDIKISTAQLAKALTQLSECEAAKEGFPHLAEALKSQSAAYAAHKGLVGEAKEFITQYDALQAHILPQENGLFAFKERVTDVIKSEKSVALEALNKRVETLKKIPADGAKKLDALSTKLGGWFGEVHSQGGFSPKALQGAVKNNFAWAEGNKLKAFGRGAIAVGAIGLVGDGLFRSKTGDGEDRSLIVRGGEIGIFAAAAALALIAGKAKPLASVAAAVK